MSKFIKIIMLLPFLCTVGCINDLSFYYDSVSESLENGLLINEYKPEKQVIEIANREYKVIEAWTAYKFKSRGSKEIYKEIIAFTFILEDINKNRDPEVELIGLIECQNKDVLFDKRVGIDDSQFRVIFNKKSINNIDTIKFVIKNQNKIYDSIHFIKK